jgi:hypothetical protein
MTLRKIFLRSKLGFTLHKPVGRPQTLNPRRPPLKRTSLGIAVSFMPFTVKIGGPLPTLSLIVLKKRSSLNPKDRKLQSSLRTSQAPRKNTLTLSSFLRPQ